MTAAPRQAADASPRADRADSPAVPGRCRPGPGWVLAAPPLLAAAAAGYGIGSASYWRDEAATLSATGRPLPQMLRMFGHVDAVHGAYDLLVWPVVHLFGTGEAAVRAPSVIAMAAAAFGVAVVGRRLWSWQAGLAAGLVFAVLPFTSRFGQEARSYAMATAAAVLASYLLIRALDQPRRRWFAWYGASLAAVGFLNLFALLIVPAHAVTVAAARRGAGRRGAGAAAMASQRVVPRWAASVACACVAAAPVAVYVWREREQLAWLKKPHWRDVTALATGLTGSTAAFVLIAALSVAGLALAGRGGQGEAGRRLLGWLAVPWLILPPVLLLAGSEIKPMYVIRYVVFCLPAVALLAGAGITALARLLPGTPAAVAALGAVAVIAVLGLPAQHLYRAPAGHGDDIRAADAYLRAHEQPGDAVVYYKPGTRDYAVAYPYGLRGLRDIGLARTAVAAGLLSGTEVTPGVLAQRLRDVTRVWLVEVEKDLPYPLLTGSTRFRLLQAVWRSDILLRLYLRTG